MDQNLRTYSRDSAKKIKLSSSASDTFSRIINCYGDSDITDDELDEIVASPMRRRRVIVKNGITLPEVDSQSLQSLDPGKMLNDTVIEFYMKYLLIKTTDINRERFHVFSTFFYEKFKILQQNVTLDDNSVNIKRIVTRWEKNVKIFNKDYLVVPICDHSHWSLVIICHPREVPHGSESLTKKKSDPRYPCLFLFDSLPYKHMSKFTEPIRKFLTYRWRSEYIEDVVIKDFSDREKLPEIRAKIPKQRNTFDCGIYLLESFEKFLSYPAHFVEKIKFEEDLTDEFALQMREKRIWIKSVISKFKSET